MIPVFQYGAAGSRRAVKDPHKLPVTSHSTPQVMRGFGFGVWVSDWVWGLWLGSVLWGLGFHLSQRGCELLVAHARYHGAERYGGLGRRVGLEQERTPRVDAWQL